MQQSKSYSGVIHGPKVFGGFKNLVFKSLNRFMTFLIVSTLGEGEA